VIRRTAASAALICLAAMAAAEGDTLPLTFAHRDHRQVNCIDCHHNFADTTGQGLCLACHRSTPELAAALEVQFHTLCRGCHVRTRQAGNDAGPVRRCSDCHEPDSSF
jgi:Zn finger protein HypA/HybF involved in hydrogenase expression